MSGILPFLTLNDFVFFTLVLARMAGLFAAIPIFGGQRVPLTVKAAAILAIALVLFPIVRDKIPQMPADTISLVILIIRESLVGLTLSLLSQVIFAAVQFCGQMIGMQMGLSMASLFDPDAGQVPEIAIFQDLLAMLLFMTLGVHHVFIRAIVESYSLVPVGAWHMSGADSFPHRRNLRVVRAGDQTGRARNGHASGDKRGPGNHGARLPADEHIHDQLSPQYRHRFSGARPFAAGIQPYACGRFRRYPGADQDSLQAHGLSNLWPLAVSR